MPNNFSGGEKLFESVDHAIDYAEKAGFTVIGQTATRKDMRDSQWHVQVNDDESVVWIRG